MRLGRTLVSCAALCAATAVSGCDDGGAGLRYRAERDFLRAEREARRLTVNPDLVGENELLSVADRFLMVGARYITVVDDESVESATSSERTAAQIGARAKLAAVQFYLRGGDEAVARRVAFALRDEVSWSPAASLNAQIAIVDVLRHDGAPEEITAELWRLAEDYPPADETGQEVYNAVFNAPRGAVRYVNQSGGDTEAALERAIQYYEGVREKWPGSQVALVADLHRSTLYDGRGDWVRAADILDEALDTYPDTVLVAEQAARVALTLGRVLTEGDRDTSRGIAAFERARVAAPGTTPAWDATLELAQHHAERGRFEAAIELYKSVAEGDSESRVRASHALFAAGRALEAAGRWDEARVEYGALEVKYPESEEAQQVPFVLAHHYREIGDEDLARSILERAEGELRAKIRDDVNTEDVVGAYRYLFNALAAREEWEVALREVDTFSERFPARPETAMMLLQAAQIADQRLGDPQRAAGFLARVETGFPNSRFAEQAATMLPELAN